MNLTELLSTDERRQTTEEDEVAKTGLYGMNEFPSLETRLIPEEAELVKGRKRSLEEGMLPPPQRGRKGGTRGSSVPPGSETAKARARAEAQRSQDVKGKGSGKGTSKEGGKDPPRIPGKLPPTFVAMASSENDPLLSIEDRKETIVNKTFYEKTWDLLLKILVDYGVTQHNLMAFEFTYLHWYQQLEHVPMSLDTEQVLDSIIQGRASILLNGFSTYNETLMQGVIMKRSLSTH